MTQTNKNTYIVQYVCICVIKGIFFFINDGLQELCKKLHAKIDSIDEDRYDLESKVNKSNKEVWILSYS